MVYQKPIRVLHVFSRMDRGGAETMIMNLYRNIDRENVQFDFVVHLSLIHIFRYNINPVVVYPHSFRHLFAKTFLNRFNDIALLADLMGHENIETTRIYLRKSSTEQRLIVNKVVDW